MPDEATPPGYIRRPLPKTKTVAEAIRAHEAKEGKTSTSSVEDDKNAQAALLAYNTKVLERLASVTKFFDENKAADPVSPVKAKDFKEFIRSHLSFVNGLFVVSGTFKTPTTEAAPISTEGVFGDQSPLGRDPVLKKMSSIHSMASLEMLGDDSEAIGDTLVRNVNRDDMAGEPA